MKGERERKREREREAEHGNIWIHYLYAYPECFTAT